jgi:hypothetical protein
MPARVIAVTLAIVLATITLLADTSSADHKENCGPNKQGEWTCVAISHDDAVTPASGRPQPPNLCGPWVAYYYIGPDGSPTNLTRTLADGTIETYYERDCPTGRDGAWWAPFSPVDIAAEAYRQIKSARLPAPQPAFAPPATAMIVNFETWFGVTPIDPVVIRAEVPNAWAQATATPVSIELQVDTVWPGTEAFITCTPWGSTTQPANGCVWTPLWPSVPKVTGFDDLTYHAAVNIVWHVTWTSSSGQGGAFDDVRTTTPINITVMEIQTIGAAAPPAPVTTQPTGLP